MTTDTLLTTQNKILLILDRINEIQDKAETIEDVEIQENYTEEYVNAMIAQLIPRVKDTISQINEITLIPQFPTNSQPKQILERIHTIPNHTNKSKNETTQHVEIQENYTKQLNGHMTPQIFSLTKNTLLQINQIINNPRIQRIFRTIQKLPDGTQEKHPTQHELLNTIYEYILSIYKITDHLLKHSPPCPTIAPPAK